MLGRRFLPVFLLALFLNSVSMAQFIGASISATPFPANTQPGTPFCADFITTQTQVLTDGNRIEQAHSRRVCRDSLGRTRTETTMPALGMAPPGPHMINIFDPVSKKMVNLRQGNKTAFMHSIPSPMPVPPRGVVADRFIIQSAPISTAGTAVAGGFTIGEPLVQTVRTANRVPPQSESLGQRDFNGVLATGNRTTHVLPAGAVGNSLPITSINETWISDELHEVVYSKNTDPRSGESVTEMKNLIRGEPDPSLFQVPADYAVQEQ